MEFVIYIAIFLVSAVVFTFVGIAIRKKIAESKVGSAENEAKRIIELAQKEAENKKKEEIFKAKEEIINARKDLDNEVRERRGEVQQQERRLLQKEENLENRILQMEKKEQDLERRRQEIENKKKEITNTFRQTNGRIAKNFWLHKRSSKGNATFRIGQAIIFRKKANLIKASETKNKRGIYKKCQRSYWICNSKMCCRSYCRNNSINCNTSK